jgi:4-amino-4-deoxy-L-arabinose transferase-like glycosyltransferase
LILAIVGGSFTLLGALLLYTSFIVPSTPISFKLFFALFLAIGALLFIIGIRLINRKEKRKSIIIFICGVIVILLLAGLWFVAVLNYESEESPPQNVVESTTNILQPTYTVLPTYTDYPTYTPRPANTQSPAPAPVTQTVGQIG